MTRERERALPLPSIRYDMGKKTGEISEPSDDDSAVKPGPHAHVATGDVPFRMIIALGGRMHGGCVPFRDNVRRNAARESDVRKKSDGRAQTHAVHIIRIVFIIRVASEI